MLKNFLCTSQKSAYSLKRSENFIHQVFNVIEGKAIAPEEKSYVLLVVFHFYSQLLRQSVHCIHSQTFHWEKTLAEYISKLRNLLQFQELSVWRKFGAAVRDTNFAIHPLKFSLEFFSTIFLNKHISETTGFFTLITCARVNRGSGIIKVLCLLRGN